MKTRSIIKKQNPNAQVRKPVSWRPASRTGTVQAPEGYRIRWCHDVPDNIAKKKIEGWEILDKTKFPDASVKEFEHQVTDSNGLSSSVLKRNELVAMVIREDIAKQRDAYHQQETEDRTQTILSKEEAKRLISSQDPRAARNIHSIDPETGDLVIE